MTATVAERRTKAMARGVGVATQVFAERAENAEIWDNEGKRYIDFAAGIAVPPLGGEPHANGRPVPPPWAMDDGPGEC